MNIYPSTPELTRALLILEGLLYGITSDDIINQKELDKLKNWKTENYDLIKHHPVGDLMKMIDSTTGNQILQEEEKQFLLDFCCQYGPCDEGQNPYCCDLIRMEGYLKGILADKKIYSVEIRSFNEWLKKRPHLKQFERYEELEAVIQDFIKGNGMNKTDLFTYLEKMVKFLKEEL